MHSSVNSWLLKHALPTRRGAGGPRRGEGPVAGVEGLQVHVLMRGPAYSRELTQRAYFRSSSPECVCVCVRHIRKLCIKATIRPNWSENAVF